jgi:hypothetical protein
MERKNNQQEPGQGRHEHPLPHEISRQDKELATSAHDEAERDMGDDAELTAGSPNDDLDEGETARLGEDKTDLV